MAESGATSAPRRPLLRGDADATGYRKPLPDRSAGAAFSINGPLASANGPPHRRAETPGALDMIMDRDLPSSQRRRLADWRLAFMTIVAFWTFYFLLTTTRAFLIEMPGQAELMRRRAAIMLVAMLLSGIVYLVLDRTARSHIRGRIMVAAVASLPAAMTLAWLNHYMFYVYSPLEAVWVGARMDGMDDWSTTKILAEAAHSWYFFFAAWAAVFVAMSSARQLREADQRAAILSRQAQEAQLRALRYQINPHFLFNTLNSLSSLVLAEKNETAERMLMNLSCFFRTTLAADPTADVPLSEEIRLQQLYLEIEQVRFPDRLRIEFDVPDRLMSRRVPVLILQPVVENSVKYGVARARRPVTLRISAHEEAGQLHLKVRDDGDAVPEPEPDEGRGIGVGLRNVCDRLASRFGDSAGCIHGPDPNGGYIVHIFFPALTHD